MLMPQKHIVVSYGQTAFLQGIVACSISALF